MESGAKGESGTSEAAGASTSVYHGGLSNGHVAAAQSEVVAEAEARSSEQSLLPGIPDEITLNHILTKVHWKTVYTLASLGRAWRSALRSREVHNARVHANSTQTLVAMIHDEPSLSIKNLKFRLSLYDLHQDAWYLLPKIPGIVTSLPESCGCVSLHGKLYIMGGRGEPIVGGRGETFFSREVYEFDPAGSGQWKQCASMICGRSNFACDVKGGRIYVFGGVGAEGASEVYYPEQDVWHGIAPMLTNRMQHKVVHVGDEFYIHMGRCYNMGSDWPQATFAEVYDSRRNQWRTVDNFTGNSPVAVRTVEAVLVMGGRIFKILDDRLYEYDQIAGTWTARLPILWDVLRFRRGSGNSPEVAATAIAVKGRLLALVNGLSGNDTVLTPLRSTPVFRILAWQKIQSSLHFRPNHGMYAIEL